MKAILKANESGDFESEWGLSLQDLCDQISECAREIASKREGERDADQATEA